ncbi:sodium:proline symporter [Ruficoccus amylovorans]|uniref:Sodium:proline symporter n=1 Tax=Ruficoccus amylovorans TaxID=1804625 RepID=A0A842HBI8_9BACT|nr:sodium:proline symporter [Ruficoccus amylovorans]MBC2592934.1 sodium:proline symporter [Ruficoccus amylovorans]
MHTIDWLFVITPLLIVFSIGAFTQKYMRSVADFMSGGRVAGRYLLAVSKGEMAAGAVVFAAVFEVIARAGFTWTWWQWINIPVGLLVATTGFVVYRYRETRAMTLAQFFEIRYSKRFRVFTGFLGFFAGLVNFGIIPVIGARFITAFVGLPPVLNIAGVDVGTHLLVMAVLLSITLFLTLAGGQITVMVTDCLEGMLSQILYLVIIGCLVWMFSWSEISDVLSNRPAGESLINPFDSMALEDFNLWYVLMAAFTSVYGTMAWQNQSAYNSAGLTPHENRMGNILGRWREYGKQALVYLLAMCAMTYLLHPDFAEQAKVVMQELSLIPDTRAQEQMRIPMAVSHMLPIGVKGAFCAVLIMGIFGGDSTHLHSWGSLFVQDVLVPLRKRPFGPRQHIRVLRRSITGVAIFAFIFGALFPQTEFIVMWWSVTMAIYIGGAGAVIIGGLYWKKGTTAAAWTALLAGSGLSVGGIIARTVLKDDFPLNGMQVSFFSCLIAIGLYVLVSLLTCKENFNMDRMLHRGKYAKLTRAVGDPRAPEPNRRRGWLARILGIDENFSRGDKIIAGGLVGWGMFWFSVFIVGTTWNLLAPWPVEVWKQFWHVVGIGIPVFMSLATAIWFTWGGTRDIFALFGHLKSQVVNELDDGTVVGHQNLDEAAVTHETDGATQSETIHPENLPDRR